MNTLPSLNRTVPRMVATIAVLGTFFCCPVASVAKPTKSANSTDIDEAWLTARPAPYLLDRPNETYVLQTDVTVDETAFVISEPGITLDLNGHTITYNNAAPIEVPNGNFAADRTGATSITDWDTSGAATSKLTISPNDCYLHSDKVLKWSVESGNTPARDQVRENHDSQSPSNVYRLRGAFGGRNYRVEYRQTGSLRCRHP